MRAIEVIIWGFGAMGSGMAEMLAKKEGIVIKGALDINPHLVGKDLYEVLGVERKDRPEVIISDDVEGTIKKGAADIVLVATDSFVEATLPRLLTCLEAGLNVISTAEEMAFPAAQSPEHAATLDRVAKENGATVLGTGINPGFVLDSLILALSGTCADVKSIYASRVNDLSPFGKAVMHEQGVGISVEEFERRTKDDSLAGHVGFPESVALIAEGLGVAIERLEQTKDPILTKVERKSTYGEAKPGHVAGIRQQVKAYKEDGEMFIHLDHPQQILPQLEGVDTADTIKLDTGEYTLNLQISPEIPGGIGTIAMVVNCIPLVLNAEPGLITMLDLPLARAVIGDFREQLKERGRKRLAAKDRFNKEKGDYVVIEFCVMPEESRAPNLPAETAELDLLARVKGHLLADAEIGQEATVKTMSGRELRGILTDQDTAATHTYGPPVEALLDVRESVRALLDQ